MRNIFALLLFLPISLLSIENTNEIKFGYMHVIKLENGDLITGVPEKNVEDEEFGEGISVMTELGEAVIYLHQIDEIIPKREYYRHNHRLYLMPTANPIGDNHFIGNYQLVMLYGGFGISDIFSFTAGRTLAPVIESDQQLTTMNAKVTFYHDETDAFEGYTDLAIGGNLAFLNDANRFIHTYLVGTFKKKRSRFTAMVFYKAGSQDNYRLNFTNEFLNLDYANGSVGLGFGLDTKFSEWHDLHFIGELWNSNIVQPQNTGVLLGLRLANESFSADFGMAFFTQPFAVPFFSFNWTPF